MYLKSLLKFASASVLAVIILFSANYDAVGQKGKGKDHGNGHGKDRGGDERENGDRGEGKNHKWKGDGDDDQRRGDHEARRQQMQNDRESQRQQAESDWNARRQQELNDRQSRRQQVRSDQHARQQEWNNDNARRRGGDDDDDDDRRGRRINQRHNDRPVYVYSNPRQIILDNIWNGGQGNWRDDKFDRKQQKRAWREERKAQRRYDKHQRRDSQSYAFNRGSDYFDNNYYANDSGYNDGSDWRQQLLRIVIGNVIGNRLGGDQQNVLSRYTPVYDNVPFNSGYNGGNYSQVSPYGRNYDTLYNDQQRSDYGYNDSSFGGNSIAGGLLDSLPIAELIERYTGGGFASQLIGNFLAQGYDQGFLAGRDARRNRIDDNNYNDPYAYEGGLYDPYSATLGENRRTLSEGYELGYRDALSGRNDYDPQSEGNVDLVSLLLNNVLSGV